MNTFIEYKEETINDSTLMNIKELYEHSCKSNHQFINELDQIKNENNTKILIYNNEKLIGFLCISLGFNKDEAKCILLLKINIINDQLSEEIYQQLINYTNKNSVNKYFFIAENKSSYVKSFMSYCGGEKIHSTYEMNLSQNMKTKLNESLVISFALTDNLNQMTKIGSEAFGTNELEEYNYNKSNIEKENCFSFIAKVNNEIIGVVTAMILGTTVSIADLAIEKNHRGNGYGSIILSNVVNLMIEKNYFSFVLSVETENTNALKVYERAGFSKVNIYNSFSLMIN